MQCSNLFKDFIVILVCYVFSCQGAASDIELDAKAQANHRLDSLNLLSYTSLLILTVLTIWLFKHRRVSFLHETGLAVMYGIVSFYVFLQLVLSHFVLGLIVGAIIRYAGSTSPVLNMQVYSNDPNYNSSLPPDLVSLHFSAKGNMSNSKTNKTYAYTFRGEVVDIQENQIDLKATFDPEIFFNIILPPIIFHAGYSLKRVSIFCF